MFPYRQPEKAYHTAEGAAAALAAATCVIPPPIMPPQVQLNINSHMDWAAIAQQWIQSQDVSSIPTAPPPPIFSPGIINRQIYEEKGEADMDVSTDEPAPYYETNPGTTTSNNQWSNAPAGWTRSSPLTTTPLQQQSFSYNRNERLFNNQEKISRSKNNYTFTSNPRKGYSTEPPVLEGILPPSGILPSDIWTIPPPINQERAPVTNRVVNQSALNVSSLQSWSPGAAVYAGQSKTTANKRSSSLALPSDGASESTSEVTLEALNRKNLPAWIREGLEKMEREKLKQSEREKELRGREEQLELKKRVEKEAMEELQAIKEKRAKGKMLSEGSCSAEANTEDGLPKDQREEKLIPVPRKRSTEDIMLLVRQTLTEILLEVTNEEIRLVSKEMKERYQKKKVKSKRGAIEIKCVNLPQKLGLSAYADSDSSSGDEDNNESGLLSKKSIGNESEPDSDGDSEEDLKETIRKRKQEFKAVIRQMEDEMAEQEVQKRLRQQSVGKRSNNDISDPDSEEDDEKERGGDNTEEQLDDGAMVEREKYSGLSVGKTDRNSLNLIIEPPQTFHKSNNSRQSGIIRGSRSNRKSSRFSDPQDTVTHASLVQSLSTVLNAVKSVVVDEVKKRKLSPQPPEMATLAGVTPAFPIAGSFSEVRRRRDDDDRSVTSSSSSRRDSKGRSRDRTRREKYDEDEERSRHRVSRKRSPSRERGFSRTDGERKRSRTTRNSIEGMRRNRSRSRSRSRDRDRDSRRTRRD